MISSLDTRLITMGPTLWLCSLNRLELSGSKCTSASEFLIHRLRSILFRFLFVGRPRSLFSAHPTTFRNRLRLLAASCRSIARRESLPCLRQTSAASLTVQPGAFLLVPLRDAFGRSIREKTAPTYTGIRTGDFGCLDELFFKGTVLRSGPVPSNASNLSGRWKMLSFPRTPKGNYDWNALPRSTIGDSGRAT
jgi:hypothetical protein